MQHPRTIVIGDVHGCLEELDELLASLAVRRHRDRLVFLGDLVDRGPDPVGVVRRVRELGAECLHGNHEDKHVRWARHQARARREPGYRNPMRSMRAEEQAANARLRDDDIAWLASLPAFLDLGDWIAVHAGIEPGRPLHAQKRAALCRVRWVDHRGLMSTGNDATEQPEGSVRWAEAWRGPQHVVYGHHVLSREMPLVDRREDGVECWALDTGCCFGGRLSALVLPERTLVQVEARAQYSPLIAED
jgi:hypothetical protein